MSIGVTVGKFNPPHMGHLHMIESGADQVDHLYVLVADRCEETISAGDRAAWLRQAVSDNVTVLITADDIPTASEPWAERALELLPSQPDLAFTSELWGPEWASLMGSRHVAIDIERTTVPISGRQLRADLREHFEFLIPPARTALAKRVVMVGAESTGKTTLAEAVAEAWETVWVPEYGRLFWESRQYLADQTWTSADFDHIAATQTNWINELASQATTGVVIVDTDALATEVWRERYLGTETTVPSSTADLYVVCAPDFAWVQDGTRESADQRQAMHERTLDLVGRAGVDHVVVEGPRADRVKAVSAHLDQLTSFKPLI